MANGKQGFASMDPARHREIARLGGKAAHASGKAHEFTSAEARVAGEKGGAIMATRTGWMQAIGQKGGRTVASRPGHMATIGRVGGTKLSQNRAHMAKIGSLGGAVVSTDREHMADIGARGGAARAAASR